MLEIEPGQRAFSQSQWAQIRPANGPKLGVSGPKGGGQRAQPALRDQRWDSEPVTVAAGLMQRFESWFCLASLRLTAAWSCVDG